MTKVGHLHPQLEHPETNNVSFGNRTRARLRHSQASILAKSCLNQLMLLLFGTSTIIIILQSLDFLEGGAEGDEEGEGDEDTLEAGTEAAGFQHAALIDALENLALLNVKLEVNTSGAVSRGHSFGRG